AKLIEEEFTTAIKANSSPVDSSEKDRFCERQCAKPNTMFDEALESTYQHITSVLQNLCSPCTIPTVEKSMTKIGSGKVLFDGSWKVLFDSFESFTSNLDINMLCDDLLKTITFGEELVNCCDNKICSHSCKVGVHFQNLHMLVDLLLKFSDELLKNFLAMHRSVSLILTYLSPIA
ncbi:midasin, partial [Trifolium medium]|nr:midasin [Trifolium medium]